MAQSYILQKMDGGMHYILLDSKTVAALTKNNNKRIVCTLNNEVTIHCAIKPIKEGGHFIHVGAATCKKLNIKAGSKITAKFSVDTTEYQFEVPEELKAVFETDPEADECFQALTKGNQRSLIYLVAQVKSSDKRIERALKIADQLKRGITSARIILK